MLKGQQTFNTVWLVFMEMELPIIQQLQFGIQARMWKPWMRSKALKTVQVLHDVLVARVEVLIMRDHRIKIDATVKECTISHGSVSTIILEVL